MLILVIPFLGVLLLGLLSKVEQICMISIIRQIMVFTIFWDGIMGTDQAYQEFHKKQEKKKKKNETFVDLFLETENFMSVMRNSYLTLPYFILNYSLFIFYLRMAFSLLVDVVLICVI
jgi:hypothetical protein